jgi:hypothetical protein
MEEAEFLSAVNSVIRNLKTKQTNLSYSITGLDFFISDPDLESIPKIFYKEHPIIKIPEILKAKKSYNRDKDKLDIMNIVKFFLNSI